MNLAVSLALGLVCIPSGLATDRLTHPVEPPQEFVLQAGGWELDMRLGHPVELPKILVGQQVTLRLRPTRLFEYEGLHFRYPQQYEFNCDSTEKGVESVTFSGQVNVLQVRILDYRDDLAVLVDSAARSIADEDGHACVSRDCEFVAKDGRKLAGKHLEAGTTGARTVQELYAVSTGPEAALLILHGSLGEDGKCDPETAALQKLLADSLEWPR